MSTKALVSYKNNELAIPVGNLEAYMNWSRTIPLLSKEEEAALARKLAEDGDIEAAKKLVLSQLNFVVRVSKGYRGYGLPLADLIQEGNIGLMKGVKRFDPSFGVRLVTFVVHWIKSEIHDYVIRNWKIVKVATTKAQRKLFFNLRSYKKKVGTWFTKEEIKAVAEELNVSEDEVIRMEQRLHSFDAAFDAPAGDDEDTAYYTPANYLEDKSQDPARLVEHQDEADKNNMRLAEAVRTLDERSQDILNSRWLQDTKATLHDLAAKYSVSAERIRQLEQGAMKKLQSMLSSHN